MTPPTADLATMLRLQTSDAHRDLEDKLALLSRPSDRQRFLAVLERFHGFHAVWETAIRRRSRYAAFHAPRSRLPHLRRDLAALGRTTGEVSRLPLCREAERLVSDDAAALGSLYVLEGSTLGGQVIARELAGAGWLPSGGLTYFNPYGPRTGEMWRGFRAWLSAQDADDRAATEGARRTFRLLQDWVAA